MRHPKADKRLAQKPERLRGESRELKKLAAANHPEGSQGSFFLDC
jgi:hypothetical protein